MDYEEIRELLCDSEPLSQYDAMRILNEWSDSPALYQRLLDEGMAVALYAYEEYSEEAEWHMFCESEKRMLAPPYAKHFFNQENQLVTAMFASFVNQVAFGEDNDGGIYAWPYLTAECVENLDAEFIIKVIEDPHFVFDFSEDANCSLYALLYQKMCENTEDEQLIAINGFNLSSEWLKLEKAYGRITLYRSFFMANHAFGAGISEGVFRKLLINYVLEIERQVDYADLQYKCRNN